tara:strand:- start:7967 stop:9520 length:1554 start_codon:yes stop_codon:yes gene_type:complete
MADNPLKLSTHAQAQVESGFNTGDLRRRYDFSDRVSELAPDQTPFFRVLSKVAKKATTDPEFKTLEQRHMWHKRYAYAVAMDLDGGVIGSGDNDNEYVNYSFAGTDLQLDDEMNVKFETDYLSAGNVQNVLGQTGTAVGASGTKPIFFLVNQMVKIPVRLITTANAGSGQDETVPATYTDDYLMVKITAIGSPATGADAQAVYAKCKVVRGISATAVSAHNLFSLANGVYEHTGTTFDGVDLTTYKEKDKCYVVGSAHAEGSSFPDTYKDTPYKDVVGYTQIWKTTMQMTNTARATELKLARDEWARVWKNKLIEHKWDIETDILFSSKQKDADGVRYTAGIVDYVLSSGNLFSINLGASGTTSDDFLDNMSDFMDPRYNSSAATMFMCDTATYNWLHKLGGFQKNDISISDQYRFDFAVSGKKSLFGIPVTTITTPYGDMNVVRNIHLDGSPVRILAVNLKHVAWRPLVGNGVNRDTAVYVGVQSLENTGVDRRIDLIQTEGGMEIVMPEAHAIWK